MNPSDDGPIHRDGLELLRIAPDPEPCFAISGGCLCGLPPGHGKQHTCYHCAATWDEEALWV